MGLLLKRGANALLKDAEGKTALHMTESNTTPDCANLLLQHEPGLLNMNNNFDQTAAHLVAGAGNATILKTLLDHDARIDDLDNLGRAPLHYALLDKAETCVPMLLDGKNGDKVLNLADRFGSSPLHYAVQLNNTNLVKMLIAKDCDVNITNPSGRTPLLLAAAEGRWDVCQILVDKCNDINATDKEGCSALHYAARSGASDLCRLLIKNGADVNLRNNREQTPMFPAASNAHTEVVHTLVEQGAKCGAITDARGRNPSHYAAENGHKAMLRLLLQYSEVCDGDGCDVCDPEDNPLHAKDDDGHTMLYLAIVNKHIDCLKMLLKRGVFVDEESYRLLGEMGLVDMVDEKRRFGNEDDDNYRDEQDFEYDEYEYGEYYELEEVAEDNPEKLSSDLEISTLHEEADVNYDEEDEGGDDDDDDDKNDENEQSEKDDEESNTSFDDETDDEESESDESYETDDDSVDNSTPTIQHVQGSEESEGSLDDEMDKDDSDIDGTVSDKEDIGNSTERLDKNALNGEDGVEEVADKEVSEHNNNDSKIDDDDNIDHIDNDDDEGKLFETEMNENESRNENKTTLQADIRSRAAEDDNNVSNVGQGDVTNLDLEPFGQTDDIPEQKSFEQEAENEQELAVVMDELRQSSEECDDCDHQVHVGSDYTPENIGQGKTSDTDNEASGTPTESLGIIPHEKGDATRVTDQKISVDESKVFATDNEDCIIKTNTVHIPADDVKSEEVVNQEAKDKERLDDIKQQPKDTKRIQRDTKTKEERSLSMQEEVTYYKKTKLPSNPAAWRKRYLEQKKRTISLEDQLNKLKLQLDQHQRRITSHLERRQDKIKVPQRLRDPQLVISQQTHDNELLRMNIQLTQTKVASETRLRNLRRKEINEIRNLRTDYHNAHKTFAPKFKTVNRLLDLPGWLRPANTQTSPARTKWTKLTRKVSNRTQSI